jgi:hypothetical protein
MIRTFCFSKNYLCIKYLTLAKVPALNWKIVPVLLILLVAYAAQQKTKLIANSVHKLVVLRGQCSAVYEQPIRGSVCFV